MRDPLLEQEAALFRALGHPARLKIVQFLAEGDSGERCVCEIIPALGMEQSTVSKHLAILRERGVVDFRREGTRMFYALVDRRVLDMLRLAEGMCLANLRKAEEVLAEARAKKG